MEKKKEKADLEQLLNSLIKKGWKPFGSNYERYEHGCLIHEFTTKDGVYSYGQYPTTIREFCAKESGLWQFVCENGMVKPVVDIISICSYSHFTDDHDDGGWDETFPEYRLIETALTDEDKLEQFLLDNIKVDVESN